MANLALDNKVVQTISLLAKQLKTTNEDVIRKAVDSYAEKVNKENRLMKFAGILGEEDANEMLGSIYGSRQSKKEAPHI